MDRIDFDARLIKLPPERVKNKRAHAVPLSTEALASIEAAPRGDRGLVFGHGAGGFGGWGAAKAALDKRIAEARAEAGLDDMPHFTLHDLRRSFSTRANELELGQPHQIEAVLNQVIGGVHGTYNRSQYEAGKRDVLERWGAHIGRLVSEPQAATSAKPKRSASRRASVPAG